MTNIISHCTELADLRLVNDEVMASVGLNLQEAMFSLKMLRRLHLVNLPLFRELYINVNYPRLMKEIVCYTGVEYVGELTETIQQSGPVLEVLVLHHAGNPTDIGPDLFTTLLFGEREGALAKLLPNVRHLFALTHLDLSMPLTEFSLEYLSIILPGLHLTHFGCNKDSQVLLQRCNIASLKSLSIMHANGANLMFLDTMGDGTVAPIWDRLEQLYFRGVNSDTKVPTHFLQSAQLARLYLNEIDSTSLEAVLETVNLSKLQEIYICCCDYYSSTERALAKRINEFTETLVVRLDESSSIQYLELGGKPRTVAGSSETLPRHRVNNMKSMFSDDHHYLFLHHVLPVYSF